MVKKSALSNGQLLFSVTNFRSLYKYIVNGFVDIYGAFRTKNNSEKYNYILHFNGSLFKIWLDERGLMADMFRTYIV